MDDYKLDGPSFLLFFFFVELILWIQHHHTDILLYPIDFIYLSKTHTIYIIPTM